MSGNVRRIEIRGAMARVAGKCRSTVPIGPTHDGVAMRLRLAGVKPNSDAMRIMISA
jgi:hypothetical protein